MGIEQILDYALDFGKLCVIMWGIWYSCDTIAYIATIWIDNKNSRPPNK
jgi:hypothetical protein